MKRLAILALAALLLVPISVNAQRENDNLGKKYGPYEVKIGKGKYMKDAPVTAIWNNETKVWVTSPIIDKKNGAMFFLPTTDVEFIEGEDYPAEAQGLVNLGLLLGKGPGESQAKVALQRRVRRVQDCR